MVTDVEFDMDQRHVTVTYNAKLIAVKNILHLIAEAGFQADDVPPVPGSESKRPQECTEAVMEAPAPNVK